MRAIGWALLATAVLASSSIAEAHNEWGLGHPSLHGDTAVTSADLAAMRARQNTPNGRYVIERILLWQPGATLTGCFYDGTGAERSAVVAAAAEILTNRVNIIFDFGAGPEFRTCSGQGDPLPIRVSFSQGCCAAYVGRMSLHREVRGGASVFLQGRPSGSIIIHELMHTLGVLHEHQSPVGGCSGEFIVENVARDYGWTVQTARDNLAILDADQHRYAWSATADRRSRMFYNIQPGSLVRGTASPCYVAPRENVLLSPNDIIGLRVAYPPTLNIIQHLERTRAGAATVDLTGFERFSDIIEQIRTEQ